MPERALVQWAVRTAYQVALQQNTREENTEALWSGFIQNREELSSLSWHCSTLCSALPCPVTRDTGACTWLPRGVPGEGATLRAEKACCENFHQKTPPASLEKLFSDGGSCLTCQICFLAPLKVRERKKHRGLIATPVKLNIYIFLF